MKTRFALVLLAACGGDATTDIEPTLRFSDLTDPEITRLVLAASGHDGTEAAQALFSFSSVTGSSSGPIFDPCPAIAINGLTVTVTGGCTTRTKVKVEGSGTIINTDWGDSHIDPDYSKDTQYELHALVIEQSGQRRSYDGTYVVGHGHTELDVIVGDGDTKVRSDMYLDDCTENGCGASGGVELIPVGGARVTGTTRIENETPTERYTLRGADTVKATLKLDCVSWVIEDTARTFDSCAR